MSQRERSLLIGGAAFVLALLGTFLGVQALISDNADEAYQLVETPLLTTVAASSGDGLDADVQSDRDTTTTVLTLPALSSSSSSTTSLSTTTTTASTTTTTVMDTSSTEPIVMDTSSTVDPSTTDSSSTLPDTGPMPPETSDTAAPPTMPTSSTVVVEPDPPPAPGGGGLDAVEREILRLTNELRANPSGPLARRKPLPSCVNEGFYGITIDGATGHPGATPALTVNEQVSIQLARAWSIEMDTKSSFGHRPNAQAQAIYSGLGISVGATGENIAWFSGYPDSEAARVHFEGWRESDTGHYCALVAPVFTHIGVGHYKGASRSWATQNFYSTR